MKEKHPEQPRELPEQLKNQQQPKKPKYLLLQVQSPRWTKQLQTHP